MPQLRDNRFRIPPYILHYFLKRCKAENVEPKDQLVGLIIDWTFGENAVKAAIPQRTPSEIKRTLTFETPDEFLTELLDTNEIFNWD